MKKTTIGIAAAIALNAWATLSGRGSFLHHVAVFGGLLWIALPILLVGGSLFLAGRRKAAPRLTTAGIWFLLCAVIMVSSVVSIFPGRRLSNADIGSAQRYCEGLAVRLEEARMQTGLYPTNLPHETVSLPRLLKGHPFYWSDGTNYQFTFPDPTSIINMFGYESGARKWQRWD